MAQKKTWIAAVMILLTCLLVACGATPTPETVIVKETAIVTQEVEVTRIVNVQETVVVTATPEPLTPTPIPSIVFEEDFESPDSGWDPMVDQDVERYFDEGRLHVLVKTAPMEAWTGNPELQSLDDFDLEVDATQVGGPDNNEYGVIFRQQNDSNYYGFMISGAGYFGLFCLVDGQFYNVVNWTEADAIQRGQSTNHLRLVADGAMLSMYANGELLATVPDNSFRRGDITLVAGAFEEADVHIAFDNLRVLEIE